MTEWPEKVKAEKGLAGGCRFYVITRKGHFRQSEQPIQTSYAGSLPVVFHKHQHGV